MKKLIVLSGAGISAESGISTFRDSNGLWENHKIEDVASPEGWHRNKSLVLDFYNQRRRQLFDVEPNKAHFLLKDLENHFEVNIITQNVDDLHERAGSSNVMHLHGQLRKSRSTQNPSLIYDQMDDINLGDTAEDGSQLRPHIVWFGEGVPMIPNAIEWVQQADIMLVIGTSMQVYPAAGLTEYLPSNAQLFVINPDDNLSFGDSNTHHIKAKATEGMSELFEMLVKK